MNLQWLPGYDVSTRFVSNCSWHSVSVSFVGLNEPYHATLALWHGWMPNSCQTWTLILITWSLRVRHSRWLFPRKIIQGIWEQWSRTCGATSLSHSRLTDSFLCWSNDWSAHGFVLSVWKGDQDRTKHAAHLWHLNSVPEEPAICWCLAFIKFLLNNPLVLNGKCKIFDGASQYKWFTTMLRDIVWFNKHY